MEVWKEIPSLPGYEASSDGRIKRLSCIITCKDGQRHPYDERILAPKYDKDGYYIVMVSKKLGHKRLHRLICEAFHGLPPKGKNEVRHLNGVKTDNRPGNIIWGSRAENIEDSRRHGTLKNQNSYKTHCLRGHIFDDKNTGIDTRGDRFCRKCVNLRAAKYRQAKRESKEK